MGNRVLKPTALAPNRKPYKKNNPQTVAVTQNLHPSFKAFKATTNPET